MITVHMIGNAHLDPVWLWNRADGTDAVLATARSACDRLDEYPDFIFTCSGQWFHEQVQVHDPALFERIRHYVDAGRWRLAGGMVIQPDCNLPLDESFQRQLEFGQEYFRNTFGRAAETGYNVDSFGHSAWLPRILRGGGIASYVFMRPMPSEKTLPARVFRWQSPDGAEVLAFRIATAYGTHTDDIGERIESALEDLPDGIDHTMCFFGCGDHGGGPARAQIEWLMRHRDNINGARIVFSDPSRFFNAIADKAGLLPIVKGELQHHAIGCYSVERRIKTGMRRAEHRLLQAQETMNALESHVSPEMPEALRGAWKTVLFNQFHDILAGTCLDPAMRTAAGELAAAESKCRNIMTTLTRRAARKKAEPGIHKIAVFNPSRHAFSGLAGHEPFLDFQQHAPIRLLDEKGAHVAVQVVDPRSICGGMRRIVFPLTVPARGWRFLRLERGGDIQEQDTSGSSLESQLAPMQIPDGIASIGGWTVRLEMAEDLTDTWSHMTGNKFEGRKIGDLLSGCEAEIIEHGPVRAGYRIGGDENGAQAWCRVLISPMEPFVRLRLAVIWPHPRQMLRMRLNAPARLAGRTDLVSGGALGRPLDGAEYPLTGGVFVDAGKSGSLGIAAPEIFSCSADERGVWLTLLRSPYSAHHDPADPAARPDHPATDLGRHEFEICAGLNPPGGVADIAQWAGGMAMPPEIWDLTG